MSFNRWGFCNPHRLFSGLFSSSILLNELFVVFMRLISYKYVKITVGLLMKHTSYSACMLLLQKNNKKIYRSAFEYFYNIDFTMNGWV